MKHIVKGNCPPKLGRYVQEVSDGTWEGMRNDNAHEGRAAYRETRNLLVAEQYCLCAYCECRIHPVVPHIDYDGPMPSVRVEHFHPKSDRSSSKNWNLDWQNLLATCLGGEDLNVPRRGQRLKNLSCDSRKGEEVYDGLILNPLRMPAFPAAFCFDMASGELKPNKDFCAKHRNIPDNKFSTTLELLQNTIKILNLNCSRLCSARLTVFDELENRKKYYRTKGMTPEEAFSHLLDCYFSEGCPAFFSVVRHCLQPWADQYLLSCSEKW